MDSFKPGDVIAIQNRWGVSHVAVLAGYGETALVAYECTHDPRPTCIRTGREIPLGVQAHRVTDLYEFGQVFRLPLRCPLYPLQEDRILNVVELQLGYDSTSAGFVAEALVAAGVMQSPPKNWSPRSLVKHLVKQGIVTWGKQLN